MIKMTNEEIYNLYYGLGTVGDLTGVKFAYAVAKNIYKLKKHVEPLLKAKEPTPEFAEFDAKRVALAKEYAIKDSKGEALSEDVGGVSKFIIKDEKGFQAKLKVLRKENKVIISARDKQVEEVKELLNQEVEVDLYFVSFSSVPKEINSSQMAGILPIIENKE